MNFKDNGGSSLSIGTNNTTMSPDSSPFIERYEVDEELELLGEVCHALL